MNPTRLLVGTLAVTSLAASACGDDDSAAADPEEFIETGSAICAEIGPQVAEAFPDPTGQPDIAFVRSFAGELADVLAGVHDRFEQLTPPEDQTGNFEALLASLNQSVTSLRQSLDDDTVAAEIVKQGPPLEEPSIAAAALGLEGCS